MTYSRTPGSRTRTDVAPIFRVVNVSEQPLHVCPSPMSCRYTGDQVLELGLYQLRNIERVQL